MGSTFGPIFSKPFYGIPPDHITLNFPDEEIVLHWPHGYDSIYLFNSKSHTPKFLNNARHKDKKFTFKKHINTQMCEFLSQCANY